MVFYNRNKPNIPQVDVVMLADDIFVQANNEGASDVHFEPIREKMIVRFRIDGILRIVFEGDLSLYEFILARIKILAGLEGPTSDFATYGLPEITRAASSPTSSRSTTRCRA